MKNNNFYSNLPETTKAILAINEVDGRVIPCQDLLDERHLDSLWFGGKTLRVKFPAHGFTVLIEAVGDVEGDLMDEEGNILESFKDTRNQGCFYSSVSHYIPDDETLHNFLNSGRLILQYNNWWELSIERGDQWYGLEWCEDDNKWTATLHSIINALPELIERFGNNGTDI